MLMDTYTLNDGDTQVVSGSAALGYQVVKVVAPKGSVSVSVLGGTAADDTNYMTYLLDPAGNMQGSDFITRSHTGGYINVIGIADGTNIEVRNSATGTLSSTHMLNAGGIVNVNPGAGIWRIRSVF